MLVNVQEFILKMTTESIEKLHEFFKLYFHQCSNRNTTDLRYLRQIIKKRNRTEIYLLEGNLDELEFSDHGEEDSE